MRGAAHAHRLQPALQQAFRGVDLACGLRDGGFRSCHLETFHPGIVSSGAGELVVIAVYEQHARAGGTDERVEARLVRATVEEREPAAYGERVRDKDVRGAYGRRQGRVQRGGEAAVRVALARSRGVRNGVRSGDGWPQTHDERDVLYVL